MARPNSKQRNTWIGFFNYHLSDEEKKGIRKLVDGEKKPSLAAVLLECVAQGYKVTLSANESTGAVICSLTGKPGSPNEGYTFSLNHEDMVTSIYAVWFVTSEVYQWSEWPVDEIDVPKW